MTCRWSRKRSPVWRRPAGKCSSTGSWTRRGRYHWIHDEGRLIAGEDGRPEVVGAWWDVTEAKAAQDELRRLAAAIEQAAKMVVVTDAQAEILYANPAFEKITGYRQSEVLGRNPRILKSGEHDRGFYQQLWAAAFRRQILAGAFRQPEKRRQPVH